MSRSKYEGTHRDGDDNFTRALAELGVDYPNLMPLVKQCALRKIGLMVLGGQEVPELPDEIPLPYCMVFIERDEDGMSGPMEYDGPKMRRLLQGCEVGVVNSTCISYGELFDRAANAYRHEINTVIIETTPSKHDEWMSYIEMVCPKVHLIEMKVRHLFYDEED